MRISDWSSDVCSSDLHWDVFWRFYQDTGARKWGRPYLTRSFFSMLGETMADKVLLMLASRDGKPIAGALNLIGADRSEEHTSELQSLMRISYAVFCLKKKNISQQHEIR